jgi:B12-binding domain/radical SAM domain protein
MDYDVLLIHPPAVYDFRKRTIFPGAMGSSPEQVQFTKVSIGILSIAEYLDRHGYKAVVDNLGYRMVSDKDFDVEEHIHDSNARVYAIGLHWQQHSQGAIEIARLCKELHPDSLVIVGGLTSTRFNEEIIQKYKFIDAVIRGEAEKPFLEFMRGLDKYGEITATPNLTYRNGSGEVRVTPLMPPSESLDEYEFTRLDLIQPQSSVFSEPIPRWSLEVCRGCIYNCNICGGSAYTYRKYLGREKPAFRSPAKIVEDVIRLGEQGIKYVGIYQDPRMGGEKYWKELMNAIRDKRPAVEKITFDIFAPVNEEFVQEAATIGKQVVFYICPDSGSNCIRESLGRFYTNEELLDSVQLCHRYHIPVVTFFSIGLAGETHNEVTETYDLWDKLRVMDQKAISRGGFGRRDKTPVGGPIIGPIFIDPGSPAYDSPEKYGYKLLFKNLEEYIEGLSKPAWNQWLNYETSLLDKDKIVDYIFESVDFAIEQGEKLGIWDDTVKNRKLILNRIDRIVIEEVNHMVDCYDSAEIELRLISLKESINNLIGLKPDNNDKYGYQSMILDKLNFSST